MMVNTMTTQTEAGLHPQQVSGKLELIPGIPDPDEKQFLERPLVNAENLTITDEGRIFVTGSLAVYEMKDKKETETYHLREIPIETSGVSRDYFRNGITVHDNSLYLACTHIHQDEKSLFPNLLGDIRKIEQNWLGFLLLGLAEGVYQVDSYILHADLKNQDLKFTDEIPLPGKCFANGLDYCKKNGKLYVANEIANCINNRSFFKVSPSSDSKEVKVESMGFSTLNCLNYGAPNGLKVKDDYIYYTCLHWFPVMTAHLKRVKINENGSFEDAEVIYQSHFSIFDDFDIGKNGFVIANIMNVPDYGAGSLLFIDLEGKLKGTFRGNGLKSPSSVKILKKDKSDFFRAGDIIITEKGRHCVSRFRPDDEWRQ